MEKTPGDGHGHESSDFPAAARLAKDGYVIRITTERCDVRMDPLQNGDNVEHSNIGGLCEQFSANGFKVEIAVNIQTMIVIYGDNIVVASKALAFVREKIVRAAAGESSSVHVDHDGTLAGTINLWRPDIDAQTVFTRDTNS